MEVTFQLYERSSGDNGESGERSGKNGKLKRSWSDNGKLRKSWKLHCRCEEDFMFNHCN